MTAIRGSRVFVLALAAVAWAAAATPAFGDCLATFPAARVADRRADPRYQSCEAVAQDYADFLAEQGRLLSELHPAYRRKLKLDSDTPPDAQAAARLAQFDDSLLKLTSAAAGLRKLPSVATPAAAASAASAAAASAASAVGSGRAAARQRLKDSRAYSQALSDRIATAREEFQPAEMTNYCKQDFMFRLGSALQARLAECLKGD